MKGIALMVARPRPAFPAAADPAAPSRAGLAADAVTIGAVAFACGVYGSIFGIFGIPAFSLLGGVMAYRWLRPPSGRPIEIRELPRRRERPALAAPSEPAAVVEAAATEAAAARPAEDDRFRKLEID